MSEAPPVLPAHDVRRDGQRHTFVLVHGSWQAGWAWDEVRGRLGADGHRVLAPTLPGHEAGAEDRAGITHDDYVDAVLRVLDDLGRDAVVLVGHSLGGCVNLNRLRDDGAGSSDRRNTSDC